MSDTKHETLGRDGTPSDGISIVDAQLIAALKRGNMALEDSDWDNAKKYFDQVLSLNAEYAEAYVGMMLADAKAKDLCEFQEQKSQISMPMEETLTAMEPDIDHISEMAKKYAVIKYLSETEIYGYYAYSSLTYRSQVKGFQDLLEGMQECLKRNVNLTRALRFASGELTETLNCVITYIEAPFYAAIKHAEEKDASRVNEIQKNYTEFLKATDQIVVEKSCQAAEQLEKEYQQLCQRQADAKDDFNLRQLIYYFDQIWSYKDCQYRSTQCKQEIANIQAKEAAKIDEKTKNEQKKQKRIKKWKKYLAVFSGAIAVVIAITITTTTFAIKKQNYNKGVSLFEVGKYDEAVSLFQELGNYKDSKEKIPLILYSKAVALCESGDYPGAVSSYLQSGPYQKNEQIITCWREKNAQTIAAGTFHTVGLKSNGTMVAIGENDDGQCNVDSWRDIVSVVAGWNHTAGLKADGTVVAGWHNNDGKCNVDSWTDVVAIAAGDFHTVGLKADGTVLAVGSEIYNKCDVTGMTNIIEIAAGQGHTVGLNADGKVVAIGNNQKGQCDVTDWTDIVAIAAQGDRTIGLKANGTVVAVGDNRFGGCNVSNWTDIVAIATGGDHTVGLKTDGTVVAVGNNSYGQCNVKKWTDIVAITAGSGHTVGQKSDGTMIAVGNNEYGQCIVDHWNNIKVIHEK